jgi:hypothetical protein
MTCRLPGARPRLLVLLGVLALPALAAAEPPAGLSAGALIFPEPPAAPPSLRPARIPVPALYRLGVTARQTLAGSLLYGIHPLLALTPTADFLDAPGDHPQPVAGDDIFSSYPPPRHITYGWSTYGWGQVETDESDWYKWLIGLFIKLHLPPEPEPEVELAQLCVGDGAAESSQSAAEKLQVMPKEDESAEAHFTCPYLREQAADRHVRLMADPQITQDVLSNLQNLEEADRLFELAGDLMRQGRVGEAMTCYEVIRRLVPGSRFEEQVDEALAEFGVAVPAESAEQQEQETAPQAQQESACWLEKLFGFLQAVGVPMPPLVNVRSSDCQPPCQVQCEWESSWYSEEAGVQEQVSGLLKACRLAAEAGDTAHAADLAREAFALDPERVAADPLVYKMHLLTAAQKPDARPSAKCGSRPGFECPACHDDIEVPPPAAEEQEGNTTAPASDGGGWFDLLLGPHGHGECGIDPGDGSVRMTCDVHCGAKVFHVRLRHGCFGLWTTSDTSDTPEGEKP